MVLKICEINAEFLLVLNSLYLCGFVVDFVLSDSLQTNVISPQSHKEHKALTKELLYLMDMTNKGDFHTIKRHKNAKPKERSWALLRFLAAFLG